MITDFGKVVIGDRIFVDKIYETSDYGNVELKRDQQGKPMWRGDTPIIIRHVEPGEICKIIRLRSSGKCSVDVTFKSESGRTFTQRKRITTQVDTIDVYKPFVDASDCWSLRNRLNPALEHDKN